MTSRSFYLEEEVILKEKLHRCSGRIRDGKFLYYMPANLKQDVAKKIVLEMRKNLANRLQEAFRYHDFFLKNLSNIDQPGKLVELAAEIYQRKYPALDFSLTIKFRRQKTVMGTYHFKQSQVVIYINNYFKNAPICLLEYIIAHELSHHHFPGHNSAFYQELSQLCVDHQSKKKLASQYLLLKEAHII